MPSTWARFSRLHQASASATETRRVARRVLAEIEAVHLRRGLRVDTYGLALGWNAGPWARKYTGATRDYAERVEAPHRPGSGWLANRPERIIPAE